MLSVVSDHRHTLLALGLVPLPLLSSSFLSSQLYRPAGSKFKLYSKNGQHLKQKQLVNPNAKPKAQLQLHFKMVPNASLAKKGPNFGHVAKKGAVFWSHIPEGNPVCLMVTGANPEIGRRREWRLLFSHLSLSLSSYRPLSHTLMSSGPERVTTSPLSVNSLCSAFTSFYCWTSCHRSY